MPFACSSDIKPLYGQFVVHPVSAHFTIAKKPCRIASTRPLVARIVTVNDDVAGVQFDPIANLSVEAVHRRFLTDGATPVIKTVTLPRRLHPVR